MGLEDLAMMCAEPNYIVLYPSDGTSAFQATVLIGRHKGPRSLLSAYREARGADSIRTG